MAYAGVVGAAGGGGVAEPGADVDHDAAGGGRGLLRLGPDLRLPAHADLPFETVGEFRPGTF